MTGVDRRRFLGGAAAALAGAVLGSACSAWSSSPSSAPGGSSDVGSSASFPTRAEIEGWIERIVEQGIRRPGYSADRWTEEFVFDELRRAGLEDVRLEPVEVPRWDPGAAELLVIAADGTSTALACFPVPYAQSVDALDIELVAADSGAALSGRAALVDARVVRMPPDALVGAGSAPSDPARRVYDPDGSFAGTEHVLPHTAERRRILDPVIEAGAAAFIGSLIELPGGGHHYFVPYDGVARPIPGVWISGEDGAWLRQQLGEGTVRVRLSVDATTTVTTSHNVVGELPGADDDLVVVGSHHDGPWASAVEDASGTALVLAQAHHWASMPREARPHRMVFVLQAGHMCGGAGLDAYLADHANDLDRIVLQVHLEHAALEVEERDGTLVATDRCTPRWFFTSRIERLEAAVYEALVAEDLRRSMLLAPDALGANPPTDGGRFHQHGVPLVQFLAAPSYLFEPADTLDKVDGANLVPLTRAAARIVRSTAGVSAAAMRAG